MGNAKESSPIQTDTLTLAGVQAALRSRGFAWHSFDRQSVGEDGVTRYWFNGSYVMGTGHGKLSKQPAGWFTLEEMLDEKFAEGCR